MPLYQLHDFFFVTARSEVCLAYVDCGGEIYSIGMFCLFASAYNCMRSDHLAEVVKNYPCIQFLQDGIILFAVPVD